MRRTVSSNVGTILLGCYSAGVATAYAPVWFPFSFIGIVIRFSIAVWVEERYLTRD